jgi:hypothetical protein
VNGLVRRFRGLLGIGVTWGTLWSAIGAAIGVVIGIVRPEAWDLANPVVEWTVGMGLYGLASGVGFGTILSLRERRRSVLDISLRRAALWGIAGAATAPVLFGALGTFEVGTTTMEVVGAILVTGALGGAFAPVAIAIARRAELEAVKVGPNRERALGSATGTSPASSPDAPTSLDGPR